MSLWSKLEQDIKKEFDKDKKSFLRQRTISKTVHVNNTSLANTLYKDVHKDKRLVKIKDEGTGNPYLNNHGYSVSTLRTLHYIITLEKHGIDINDLDHITEIGPGYGNFCRIIKKLGYNNTHYMVDLPVMHELQKYFLEKTSNTDNLFFTQISSDLKPSHENSMFYATFSLNELTIDLRKLLEENYDKYKYIFIVHNKKFPVGNTIIDNVKYFSELREKLLDTFEFTTFHKKIDINGYFMIGKRRDL